MRSIVLSITLLHLPFAAIAGDEWDFAMPHKSRCSDGGQQQMNSCLAMEEAKVDIRLNDTYKRLVSALDDASKLRKAQAAWIRFRDLSCAYENSGITTGGSLYPFATSACRIDLAEKRLRDLEQYLEWNCNGCPPRKP
jgi:uncharacterized protein YecT (DUF1311 family)